MSNGRCTKKLGAASMVAALVWAASSAASFAQCGGHGGGMMNGHSHAAAADDSHRGYSEHPFHLPSPQQPPPVERTPHGGMFLEARSHRLEVVYLPQETRVYLYGQSMEPLSTLGLRGEMSPHGRRQTAPSHIPLQHAPSSGPKDQDYLVAATDMSQFPDDTPITFRFENLPDRRHPKAEFTPIFYPSQIRPYVVRASFVEADQVGFAQQQTCPVTGARLGSMGAPAKVLVGDRPLYLCCAGCIEKVRQTPRPIASQAISSVSR